MRRTVFRSGEAPRRSVERKTIQISPSFPLKSSKRTLLFGGSLEKWSIMRLCIDIFGTVNGVTASLAFWRDWVKNNMR